MPKIKSIAQVIVGAMVSFSLVPLGEQVALARRPYFLLETLCADSGPGNWSGNSLNVSIGRAAYRSLLSMSPGNRYASLTCRIKPINSQPVFQRLTLAFGMRDNDRRSPATRVNIYLDGRQAVSRTVSPAERAAYSIDVSNVSNVAIETTCTTQAEYCDRVYFYDATLEPITPPPRQKK